ncbi:MAG TPA: MaoC family dehydratase N-terminal domain-containing protein [Rhodopila sp.]
MNAALPPPELLARVIGELQALIGARNDPVFAEDAVEASEVRRFIHATMDDPARYADGTVPLGFPVHMFRRGLTEPDPLDAVADKDFDGRSQVLTGRDFEGVARVLRPGLPAVEVPLTRLLNGGYEYLFYRRARIGERVYRISSYHDFALRQGSTGPNILVRVDDAYFTADDAPLLNAIATVILR